MSVVLRDFMAQVIQLCDYIEDTKASADPALYDFNTLRNKAKQMRGIAYNFKTGLDS